MATPVRITFRDMSSSAAVSAHVTERASKLENFYHRIVDCHVVVGEPHRRSRKEKQFDVRIEMNVPPRRQLVISKTPQAVKQDMHVTIDEAFNEAERILEDHARQQQRDGHAIRHVRPPHGVVARVFHGRGYGFIEADADGHELYFHRNSIVDGTFEKLEPGAKVRFAEEDGDNGPQASTVHIL